MIEARTVSAMAAVETESRRARGVRRLGVSVAAAMLAGTALVPATAQTFDIGGGPLIVTDFAGPPLNNPTTITNGQLTVDAGADLLFGGLLDDSLGLFSLTKTGAASLTLTGTNTYTGGTVLQSGSLVAGNASAFGTGAISVTGNAALSSLGTNYVIANAISIAPGTTLSVSSVAGVNNFMTLSGVISGSGVLRRDIAGATVRLTGANSYSGGTEMNSGTLAVGNNFALGTGAVTVTGNSTLTSFGANREVSNAIIINGGVTLGVTSATNQVMTLAGTISGTGTLSKGGSNAIVRLTGANTYSGGTTLTGGRVEIGTNSAFGTGAITTAAPNASTIALADPNIGLTLANNIILSGASLSVEAPAAGRFFTLSGTITGALASRTLTVSGANAGTVVLNGNNSIAGNVNVNSGWLGVGSAGALGGTGALVFADAAQGLVFLAPGLDVARRVTNNNLPAQVDIDTGAFNASLSGRVQDNVNGTLGLTKVGTGILTLSNPATDLANRNILGGGAQVNEGTLNILTGALNGVVTVNSGGTLAGTGSVTTGTTTINSGGTLSPGDALVADSVGTLTFANLTTNAGSVINFNLAAPAGPNDLIVVNGNANLAGTLNLAGLPGFGLGTYTLLTHTGTLTNNLSIGTTPVVGYTYNLLAGVNALNLQVSLADLYWDGAGPFADATVNGGTGVWNAVNTNWTDATGTLQIAYVDDVTTRAFFQGTAGTVSLDETFIFSELHFLTDGYVINPVASESLASLAALVNVADGVTATVNATIDGPGGLTKTGNGTLNLGATNSYVGGTFLNAGRINVRENGGLGVDGVTMAAGTTLGSYGGQVTVGNAFTIAGGVTFAADTLLRLDGAIGGTGGFTKTGAADLSLGAANSFTGNVNVNAGSITLYNSASLGDAGNVLNLADGTGLGVADGVTLANAITLAGAASVSQPMGGTATLAGVISGAGPLTLSPTGTLNLTGANSYTGGTTITSGTIGIGDTNALGTGNVTVTGAATLVALGPIQTVRTLLNDFAINADTTVNGTGGTAGPPYGFSGNVLELMGALTGSGNLQVVGGGALALGGNNAAYTGNLIAGDGTLGNGGRLRLLSADALGSGTITLNRISVLSNFTGGTVTVNNTIFVDGNGFEFAGLSGLNADSDFIINGNIIGTGGVGSFNKLGDITVTLNGTNNYNQLFIDGGGVVAGNNTALGNGQVINTEFGGSATITAGADNLVFGNGIFSLKALVLDTAAFTMTLNGNLNNNAAHGITKNGSGTLILNGASGFTGGLNVTAGTVVAGSNTALGAGAVTLAAGTTLRSGASVSLNNDIAVSGGVTFDTPAIMQLNGVISGSGGITKTGSNGLALAGNNSFTGGFEFTAGQINLLSSTGFGDAGNLVNVAAGTFGITLADGLNVANAFALAGATDIAVGAGNTATLSGNISGAGSINKLDAGTLILAGNNGHAGGTAVSGTLQLNNSNAAGTGTITLNGATLAAGADLTLGNLVVLNGDSTVATNGQFVTLNGAVSGTGGLSVTTTAVAPFGGGVTLANAGNSFVGTVSIGANAILGINGDGALGAAGNQLAINEGLLVAGGTFTTDRAISLGGVFGRIDVNGADVVTANGLISGSQLRKGGNGTLVVGNGGNSFTDGVSIFGDGTLAVAASNALGGGFVDLIDGTLASVGSGVVTLANAVNIGGAGNFITIADAGNTLELNGVLSGADNFTKTGDGILRLNGANSYSGDIQLTGGEIDLEGSIAGGINASNGARVTGGGTAGGTTVIADGAVLSPGNSPGVLNFVNLVLNNGSLLDFELAGLAGVPGVDADLINVTGDLTLDGVLNITGLPGFNVGTGNRTLLTYGNLLADNTLTIATAPPVDVAYTILTGPVGVGAGVVQLNVAFGGTYRWDGGANPVPNGIIDGGSGTFNLVNNNFTNSDGTFNLAYGNNATDDIEFGGTAGSVDVMSAINFDQMDFVTTGYTVGGAGSFNVNNSAINLGANNATILTNITGGALTTTGIGSLTLAGNNSFATLTVNAGTLVAGSDTALGAGTASFGPATSLVAQGNRTLGNDIVLAGGISLDAATNDLTLGGAISGTGPVFVFSTGGAAGARDGRVFLNGANSYTGVTVATNTSLIIGSNAALGNAAGALTLNNSELRTTATFTTARAITLGGTGAPTFNTDAGTTLTANGVISGAQMLQKVGDGTLVLGNAGNSFSGGLEILAGTVAAGSDDALGDGNIRFAGAGGTLEALGNILSGKTITLDASATINTNANTVLLDGAVSGAGGLTKTGSGNLILNVANSYTGGTALNAGTITVGNSAALGSNPLVMADATTLAAGAGNLTLANAITTQGAGTIDTANFLFTLGGVIDGAGSITKNGTGNLVLNVANSYAGGTTLNAGTITVGDSSALSGGQLTMANATILSAGAADLALVNNITLLGSGTVHTSMFTMTLNGVIDGAGALVKTGGGNLVLNGANSHAGGNSILAGTVTAGNNTAFGTGLVNMANGTTLTNNTDNLVIANDFVIGNVTVATGANSFTMGGTVNGAGLLTKTGSGNLVLNGANGYTGGTALTEGTITVGTSTALGTGQLTMTGGTNLVAGAADLALANGVTTLGAGTIDTAAFTLTLDGVVDGAGSITKIGSGNLVLNNANSFAGGSNINAGTVTVGNNSALGTGQVVMLDGTTLANNANNLVVANNFTVGNVTVATGANIFTLTGAIDGTGPLTKTGAGTLVLTGTNSYAGGTFLNEGALQIDDGNAIGSGTLTTTAGTTLIAGLAINTPTLTLANNIVLGAGGNTTINLLGSNYGVNVTTGALNTNGTPLVLNGVISGDGGITTNGFLANGGGSITFNSTNTFTGGVNLGSVIAYIGADNALGTGTVNLNEFGAGIQNTAPGTTRTLVNDVNVNNFQHSIGGAGNLVMTGLIGGASELFKVNDGTVTFTGVGSTYGGTMTVNDGTVLVNGSFVNAAANVIVAGGATIGGTGTIAGSVSLANGANLNPGTSPGTLTVGNLSLSSLTNVNFELGAANTLGGAFNDRVIVTGNLVLDGLLNISETVSGTFGLGIYNLFSYGTLTDNGLTINGALPNALTGSIQHNATAQQINLVVAGPGSVVLNWDGSDFTGQAPGAPLGQGGSGVWNATNTNWTGEAPGEVNATWQPNAVGIFGTTGGTVDVASAFTFAGLAFQAGGYTLANAGGSLGTNATTGSFISVDPTLSATINATITGTGVLMKQGTGTLVLGGTNTNSGGVNLMNGTLAVTSDAALGTGVLTFTGGTMLRTDANVTIANAMVLNGTSTIDTLGNTATLNGVLSGTGLLFKAGSGNLTLNAASTYTGGTTLNAGSITVGNNAALGGGAVTMADATSLIAGVDGLNVANAITTQGAGTIDTGAFGFTLSGVIDGAGSIVKIGAGNLTLTNANLYAGGTSLNAGSITVTNGSALGTGTLAMANATSLIAGANGLNLANAVTTAGVGTVATGTNTLTLSGVVSGAGSISKTGSGNLILAGTNLYSGGTALTAGTITVTNNASLGTGQLTMSDATTLAAGAADIVLANGVTTLGAGTIDTAAFTFTLNGVIDGAGSIVKTGAGNLVLNGANSFAGGTALNAGTITVGNNSALGSGTLTAADATSLVAGAGGLNVANAVTLNGGLTVDSGAGSFQLSGVVGVAGSITKVNGGNLILSGVNGYTGGTNLNAGAITITNDSSIGTGALTAAGGTTLFNGLAAGAGAVTLANAVVLNGGLTINLQGTVGSVNADGSLNSTGNALTLNGVISGTGSLSAVGGASLFLNGANSYAGGTSLNQVAAFAGTDTAFGSGDIAVENGVIGNNSGATRTLANNISIAAASGLGIVGTNDLVLNGVISGDGALGKFGVQTLTLNGANTFTGGASLLAGTIVVGNDAALGTGIFDVTNLGFTTTLQAGVDGLTIANAIDLDAPANLVVDTQAFGFTLGGEISSDGAITKVGSGNLILAGTNLYSGGTALTAGTITVTNNASLGTGQLTMSDATTLAAGAADVALANGITTLGTGTIDTAAFTFTLNGVIDGAGSIVKTGAGNLVLNGANSFAGTTAINAGTVTVGNNNAFSAGQVTMADGTTLANNANNLAVANNFTIGNVTIATGANNFSMTGTIGGAGLLTKTGTGTLILTGNNAYTGGTALTQGTITVGSDTALGTGTLTTSGGTALNAGTAAGATITLANTVVLGAGRTTVNLLGTTTSIPVSGIATTDGSTLVLNGDIAGAGDLFVNGAGFIRLNGNNSYAGGTTLEQRVVAFVGSDTAFGTGDVTLAPSSGVLNDSGATRTLINNFNLTNAAISFGGANDMVLTGTLSGAAQLSKVGPASLTISNASTRTGQTYIGNGEIVVGNDLSLGTGALRIDNGSLAPRLTAGADGLTLANAVLLDGVAAPLTINTAANMLTMTGVFAGVGSVTKIGGGTLVLTADNTYAGGTALNAGTIQVTSNTALGTGALVMAGGTTLQSGAADLVLANNITTNGVGTIDTQAFTFTLNGVIGGVGSIVKTGAGNLVLNGANTFSGGSSLVAGTVTLGNNTALGTGTVNIDGAVTLVSGIDNLAIANNVVLNSGVTLDTAAFTTTYSGVISGAAGITKVGSGNLILSGSNSYAGGTALTTGSITFTTDTAFGTGAITTTGGTTLVAGLNDPSNGIALNVANAIVLGAGTTFLDLQGSSGPGFFSDGSVTFNGTDLVLGGVISGTGALNISDSGRVTLNGDNSYSGGTTVNSAVVLVGSDTALGTGAVTVAGSNGMILGNSSGALRTLANDFNLNSFLVVTGPNDITLNGVISGAQNVSKASTSTLTLNGVNTHSGFTSIFGGRITVGNNSALGTSTLNVFSTGQTTTLAAGADGLVLANNVVLDTGSNLIVESGAGSFTLGGVIAGNGALTKIQTGTLILNGANTFTGGTSLNVGTIQVGTSTALGTGGLVMADSTTLQAGVDGLALANLITTNGVGTIDTQGFAFTLDGVVDGAGSLTKIGAGNLVLNGANAYAGGSFINAGTVTVGSNTALGSGAAIMLDGTTLATNSDGLALANEFNIGNITVATGGFSFTLNGPIGGSGLLTKTGSGNLVLNGSNAYGGGTALTAGTITIGSNSALGSGQLTMSGGTFLVAGVDGLAVANGITTLGVGTIDTGSNTLTLSGVIDGAGSITKTSGGTLILQGANSYAGGTLLDGGTITVSNDSALGTGLLTMAGGTTLNAGVNVTIANAITGAGIATFNTGDGLSMALNGVISGIGQFNKTGAGLLVLNGDNSFSGGFALNGGTVRTGSNTALGTGAVVTAGGTTLQNGANGVVLANSITLGGPLTIDTQGLAYTLNGVISGSGPITKIGAANLTLNGANSYAGGTLLNLGSITVGANTALGTGTLTLAGGTSLIAGANNLALANAIATLGVGTIDTGSNLLTLSGVISGAGSISKIGSGNLVVTGANSYTGGTALNAGTITVGNDSALGTGALAMAGGTTLSTTGNITLANALSIAGVGTVNTDAGLLFTLNGIVSGSGSLAKTGAGILVLNGANSYSGGTALNAGTIRVGNDSALGTGGVAAAAGTTLQAGGSVTLANDIVMAGGMTVDNYGNLLTLGGVLSGTGPLSVIDSTGGTAGVLTLAGVNSYTGGTVVTGTTVSVSQDANLGNVAGGVTLIGGTLRTTASFATDRGVVLGEGGGTLAVATGTAFTVNGVISGTRLTKNSGELVLTAANSYTGGTALNAGTITVANNLALGTGALDMADGTTLNTATNLGTTPNSPTVTLANAITTAGVGTINTNSGLTLVANGVVSGAGSINKTGAGLLVLNGANSYTGGTTLAAGTIRTGTGTALGTGRLTTTGGTTLQAGAAGLTVANAITLGTGTTTIDTQAFSYTLSGVASGAGGVAKIGSGVLTLSGASTYTGATTVAAGTLNVSGSLVSAVTVNSGAAITGTGTVGALNVLAGGSVNPATNGTTGTASLTVTGAATLAGTYTANITPSANDRITAGGALTLGGTLAVVPGASPAFTQFNQTFTVASGASLTGTFATVTGLDQFGIAFAPTVNYTATQANIRLAPQSLVVLGNRFGGISGNQLEVAQAFDRAVAAGYNPQAFFNVYANAGSNLPTTLRQMSGEQRATERRVVLDTNRVFRESALDRLNGGLTSLGGQQVSSSDGDRSITFWLRGAGSWGKAQTSGAATGFTTEQRGILTGLDWAKGGLTVGAMFHYTSTDVEYRVLGGTSNVETVGGTAYAGYRQDGGLVLNGGVSVAGARTSGGRAITLPSFAQTLSGTTRGTTYQFFGEFAWDLAAAADTRIEPFARFTYVRADMGGLTETGGVAALSALKQNYDLAVTNVGARVGATVADGKVLLNASASYQHTGDDRDAATIIGIPAVGQNGVIRSVAMDRDSLSVQADASVNVSDTVRFSLGYSGLIGKRNDDHGGRATLNIAF